MAFAPLSESHICGCGREYKVYATFHTDQRKCPECMANDFLTENPTIHCKECNKDFVRQIKDFRKEVLICSAHKSSVEVSN